MLDAIRELDMVLMAYSPLQSGLLTGAWVVLGAGCSADSF